MGVDVHFRDSVHGTTRDLVEGPVNKELCLQEGPNIYDRKGVQEYTDSLSLGLSVGLSLFLSLSRD